MASEQVRVTKEQFQRLMEYKADYMKRKGKTKPYSYFIKVVKR